MPGASHFATEPKTSLIRTSSGPFVSCINSLNAFCLSPIYPSPTRLSRNKIVKVSLFGSVDKNIHRLSFLPRLLLEYEGINDAPNSHSSD